MYVILLGFDLFSMFNFPGHFSGLLSDVNSYLHNKTSKNLTGLKKENSHKNGSIECGNFAWPSLIPSKIFYCQALSPNPYPRNPLAQPSSTQFKNPISPKRTGAALKTMGASIGKLVPCIMHT